MRHALLGVVVLLVVVALVGCQAPGTDVRPFDSLNAQLVVDDGAINLMAVALGSGAPVQKEAAALYTGEVVFLNLVVPLEESAAVKAAAPTLAPDAITKVVLDQEILTVRTDLGKLHLVGVMSAANVAASATKAVKP